MNDKILFILNPISGLRGDKRRKIRKEIIKQIRIKKLDGEIRYSRYAGHSSEIAKEAIREEYKYIVVSGGDGSINEVAKELINTDCALGIIPSGSGNGLAHYLKLPFEIEKCINIIKNKKIQKADVLEINGRYVFSIAGIGFDAIVAEKYSKIKTRGFMAYFNSIVSEYFSFKPEKIKLITDDHEIETEIFCIVFANSNQFGYNFKIAPKANIFDGIIDIILIKPIPLVSAPFSSLRIFSGHADKSLYIDSFQCKNLKIIREQDGFINIDGDPIIMNKEINVKILDGCLNLIVP
ncbi:MAG: YegS/Rv2252/BmrU family lipid kinase [Bacteroidales bacterium]|nr:YegS/Rv2252/BmrU family lipid kinase [Bacteroidales bacterium]